MPTENQAKLHALLRRVRASHRSDLEKRHGHSGPGMQDTIEQDHDGLFNDLLLTLQACLEAEDADLVAVLNAAQDVRQHKVLGRPRNGWNSRPCCRRWPSILEKAVVNHPRFRMSDGVYDALYCRTGRQWDRDPEEKLPALIASILPSVLQQQDPITVPELRFLAATAANDDVPDTGASAKCMEMVTQTISNPPSDFEDYHQGLRIISHLESLKGTTHMKFVIALSHVFRGLSDGWWRDFHSHHEQSRRVKLVRNTIAQAGYGLRYKAPEMQPRDSCDPYGWFITHQDGLYFFFMPPISIERFL